MAANANTDAWLVHACNHHLPEEQIPLLLEGGAETGEDYGWPSGLMGPKSTARLHQMGIFTTSGLIRIANELSHDQFRKMFGGSDNVWPVRYAGVHGYLMRVISSEKNAAEYQRRLTQTHTGPIGVQPRKPNARDALCGYFRQYLPYLPDELSLALCITISAFASSCIVWNHGPIARMLMLLCAVSIGLFVLQKRDALSIGTCFWLAMYPFVAQLAANYLSDSWIVGLTAFFVLTYAAVAAPHKFPVPL